MIELESIGNLIQEKSGLSSSNLRLGNLLQAVRLRTKRLNLKNLDEYYRLLADDPGEVDQLVSLVTINESYFFREPGQFQVLSTSYIPRLLKRYEDSGKPIKILSAGCATGEEPYTVAISLVDKYGSGILRQLSIQGVDIDPHVIEQARTGVFRKHSFRGVSSYIRQKYFENTSADISTINPAIKNAVHFQNQNLLNTPYPHSLLHNDIILYRNVSIYFEAEVRKVILNNLARSLNEGGVIIMSSAETLGHDFGILRLVKVDGLFVYTKSPSDSGDFVPEPSPGGHRRSIINTETTSGSKPIDPGVSANSKEPAGKTPDSSPLPEPPAENYLREARDALQSKRYDEALTQIDFLMRQHPDNTEALSLKASIYISQNRFSDAKVICREILVNDEWNSESLLQLGFIYYSEEELPEALRVLKKVVYCDPTCWLAHYYLATIYDRQNESESARREYGIVVNQLRRSGIKHRHLHDFPLSHNVDHLIHLCEFNMRNLIKEPV